MKKRLNILITIVFCGILFLNCKSSKDIVKPSNINISGNWSLLYLNGKSLNTLSQLQIPSIQIDQSKKSISGYTGCNTFSGQFTYEKGYFDAPNLIATLMICDEKNIEPELMQAIDGKSKVYISNGLLTFKKEDKIVAQFEKGIENALLSGNWILDKIDGRSANTLFYNSIPSISFFSADDNISGYAGCNDFSANYQVYGFTLSIGSIITTRKACNNSSNESKFIQNLSGISTIKINDNKIIILKNNEEKLLFRKKSD